MMCATPVLALTLFSLLAAALVNWREANGGSSSQAGGDEGEK